jgi:hypothetical protein
MSIEDKIADLLRESEALQMAEACKTKMKESDKEDDEDSEEDLDEALDVEKVKVPVGERPKGPGWSLHRSGQQHNEPHDTFKRKTKKVLNTNVNEDIDDLDEEQLDELSKKTLGSYVKKASDKLSSHGINMVGSLERGDIENSAYHGRKIHTRQKGIAKAVNKLTKEDLEDFSIEELEDFMMSEDYEQLDELSKKTLGSYVKKATSDVGLAGFVKGVTVTDPTRSKEYEHAASMNKKRKVGINRAVDRLTKEDIDADVDALMNGENLTEEFREKATAIFEAAVMSRVTQEVESLEEEFQDRLVEYYEGAKEEIVEKVDGYLNYVVEQWMNDNELAVTTGIKNDILEGFVSGMKNLFQEHYIEVPDEKLDLVAELQESVAILESKLDESLESNVEMSKYINYVERNTITEEFCKTMTDTEVEKFKSLAEELSFEDSDTYSSKLQIIKENYFGKKPTAGTVQSIVTDSPVQLTESVQNIDPNVAQYLETFNRIKL